MKTESDVIIDLLKDKLNHPFDDIKKKDNFSTLFSLCLAIKNCENDIREKHLHLNQKNYQQTRIKILYYRPDNKFDLLCLEALTGMWDGRVCFLAGLLELVWI